MRRLHGGPKPRETRHGGGPPRPAPVRKRAQSLPEPGENRGETFARVPFSSLSPSRRESSRHAPRDEPPRATVVLPDRASPRAHHAERDGYSPRKAESAK